MVLRFIPVSWEKCSKCCIRAVFDSRHGPLYSIFPLTVLVSVTFTWELAVSWFFSFLLNKHWQMKRTLNMWFLQTSSSLLRWSGSWVWKSMGLVRRTLKAYKWRIKEDSYSSVCTTYAVTSLLSSSKCFTIDSIDSKNFICSGRVKFLDSLSTRFNFSGSIIADAF